MPKSSPSTSKPLSDYPEHLRTEIAALRDLQAAMERKMRLRDLAAKLGHCAAKRSTLS